MKFFDCKREIQRLQNIEQFLQATGKFKRYRYNYQGASLEDM